MRFVQYYCCAEIRTNIALSNTFQLLKSYICNKQGVSVTVIRVYLLVPTDGLIRI